MAQLPADLDEVRSRFDRELCDVMARIDERLVGLHSGLRPLSEELRAFVSGGGKRLRPVLLLVGFRAAGGGDITPALGPALGVELLHTSALVHDDLVDDAATRRGRPTAHVAFADRHRDAGWAGGAETFGASAALLLGDLAFVLADELFAEAAAVVPPQRFVAALRSFTAMREELTAGQFLDLVAAHDQQASAAAALAIASYKSGRYSVARPLEIGAILAAGEGPVSRALRAAGVPLGEAFQLRDDILGVFGSEVETGKSARSDLAQGKRTLLVALTIERLRDDQRSRFDSMFGKPDLTAAEADELRDLMSASGGLAATEAKVDQLAAEARTAIDASPIAPDQRRLLQELAAVLVERRR